MPGPAMWMLSRDLTVHLHQHGDFLRLIVWFLACDSRYLRYESVDFLWRVSPSEQVLVVPKVRLVPDFVYRAHSTIRSLSTGQRVAIAQEIAWVLTWLCNCARIRVAIISVPYMSSSSSSPSSSS
eukprot:1188493-Rhodomonas_salina.2